MIKSGEDARRSFNGYELHVKTPNAFALFMCVDKSRQAIHKVSGIASSAVKGKESIIL